MPYSSQFPFPVPSHVCVSCEETERQLWESPGQRTSSEGVPSLLILVQCCHPYKDLPLDSHSTPEGRSVCTQLGQEALGLEAESPSPPGLIMPFWDKGGQVPAPDPCSKPIRSAHVCVSQDPQPTIALVFLVRQLVCSTGRGAERGEAVVETQWQRWGGVGSSLSVCPADVVLSPCVLLHFHLPNLFMTHYLGIGGRRPRMTKNISP